MTSEVKRRNWINHLMGALKNLIFGLIVFALGIWVLWRNEHRAVRNDRQSNELSDRLVEVPPDSVSDSNEGKPVHLTGRAATQDLLRDPFFEVEANALRLRRKVEMYQWKEILKSTGPDDPAGSAGKVAEPEYEKVWSEQRIDSSVFRETGYDNPGVMQPEGWTEVADTVTLESFTLSREAVAQLRNFEPYDVFRATLPEGARLENSVIKFGSTGSVPGIGDLRVTFQIVPQGTVSVIAAQSGSELKPWQSRYGSGEVLIIKAGVHSAEEMLGKTETGISWKAWLFRLGGWLLMSFGMRMVLTSFAAQGDFMPLVENLTGGGLTVFSLFSGGILALVILGSTWIATRPLIGISCLAGAVLPLVLTGLRFHRNKRARETVSMTQDV